MSLVLVSKLDSLSLLVLMIETPHKLHTHSRSTYTYMYAIQHLLLLLWLVVKSMQLQPDIAVGEVE
jgi:hypothetical protein